MRPQFGPILELHGGCVNFSSNKGCITGLVLACMFASACAPSIETTNDTPSPSAQPLKSESSNVTDVDIPAVVIDSRGFKQAWGYSQSSLQFADYLNELELTAARIDLLPNVPTAWSRFARKLREEAKTKLLSMTKLPEDRTVGGSVGRAREERGVSQDDGILIPVAAAETYASAYASEYKKQRAIEFEKNVRNVPLPVLYDALIEGIRDGSLKHELPKVGVKPDDIPMKLVRKASKARSDAKCKLDPSESKTKAPSKIEMLLAYLGSNCNARKKLYRAVKGMLVTAKKKPEVQDVLAAKFDEIFPEEFKKGFQAAFSEALATAHLSLQKKIDPSQSKDLFGGFTFLEPYWQAPSAGKLVGIEEVAEHHVLVNLQQLGLTLGAQTQVAADLLDSQDRMNRIYGTIATYGAMEKMLYLLGRPGAVVVKGIVQTKPLDKKKTREGAAPEVLVEPKGGTAFNLETGRLEPWNLETDLTREPGKKIYPQWILTDARGGAVEMPKEQADALQRASHLPTLVSLIEGALSFFELSTSARTIGMKFGEATKVIDPLDRSTLFAAELRDLPLGVIATSLKAILDHHIVGLDAEGRPLGSLDPEKLAGMTLRERSGDEVVLDAAVISRALLAMVRVARALGPDGALAHKREFDEVREQLAMALPLATLNLGKQLQDADGGFHARFDLVKGERLGTGARSLGLQALVLMAHLEVYRLYGTPAILRRAVKLFGFLKSPLMWSAGARFFRSEEMQTQSQFRAQDLLRLLSACMLFDDVTGLSESRTQATALAERIRELLEGASLGREFETLGLVTP